MMNLTGVKVLLGTMLFTPFAQAAQWPDILLITADDQASIGLFDLQSDPEETRNLADGQALAPTRRRLDTALQRRWFETTGPLMDAARLNRWVNAAELWKKSSPRLEAGPYPDVAGEPPAGLELRK